MTTKLHKVYGMGLLALSTMLCSSAGCRSANFSLPKMSMFSWNKKPDAATLTGNPPPAGLPESPAARYDAASTNAMAGKSPASGVGSAYGYGATGSGASGMPGQTAQSGLAAAANGYQTGPYHLGTKAATVPAGTMASSTSTAPATPGGLPSPYGGTYAGMTGALGSSATSITNVALPSSVAATSGSESPSAVGVGSGLPPLPNATAGVPPMNGYGSASLPALPAGYTSGGTTPAITSGYQLPAGTPAPPALSSPLPATSAGTGGFALPSIPGTSGAGTSNAALPISAPPVSPVLGATSAPIAPPTAYQGATLLDSSAAGAFSPGSTGRTTSYNFGGSAPTSSSGSTTAPSGTTGSLPALPPSNQSLLR